MARSVTAQLLGLGKPLRRLLEPKRIVGVGARSGTPIADPSFNLRPSTDAVPRNPGRTSFGNRLVLVALQPLGELVHLGPIGKL